MPEPQLGFHDIHQLLGGQQHIVAAPLKSAGFFGSAAEADRAMASRSNVKMVFMMDGG
jgi:hypothetical protein